MNARAVFVAGIHLWIASALADGCFVFRWDKKADINEPTQKAVILHHAGREDLLLQVKYEGAVDEFGWLIPVPSLPAVERGSMDAFYELSQLTQRMFGGEIRGKVALGGSRSGEDAPQKVKVIETKTVGAYQVSILAAADAGSLERWLKENRYSIPGGKDEREILEDYIRRGWFFVAAKINLNEGSRFRLVSSTAKTSPMAVQTRSAVQDKLAAGELHPLLISFDTPRCVFPLKISAVSGKPSEVSLYILSEKPLLNRFIFDERCKKLEQERFDSEKGQIDRTANGLRTRENMRIMALQVMLYAGDRRIGAARGGNSQPGWSLKDLQATVRESAPATAEPTLEDEGYGWGGELLHCMLVNSNQITRAAKSVPRLKSKRWHLTKLTRVFSPSEMRDLEFEPAIPVLAETLAKPAGPNAALLLARLGPDGASALISQCGSDDSTARKNAALGLEFAVDGRAVQALLSLLRDQTPAVRLHAARAAGNNWDGKFAEPLVGLFRDPQPEIRAQATECLAAHEPREAAAKYAAMARNSDLNVRMCALGVTARLNPDAVPPEPLREMLKDSNPDIQNAALHTIWRINRPDLVSREELLSMLNNLRMENIFVAWNLITRKNRQKADQNLRPAPGRLNEITSALTSLEAVPLATNRFAEVRLLGLRVLQRNADEKATELTLSLLQDTNAIVRNRAFAAMKAMTGENLSDNDPSKWETWWRTNKVDQTRPANAPNP